MDINNSFSALASPKGILSTLGLNQNNLPPATVNGMDISTCTTALNEAEKRISVQDSALINQDKNINYLKETLPNLSNQLNEINKEIMQKNVSKYSFISNTDIPLFYISIIILILIIVIGNVYNTILTKNLLGILEKNGVLDALSKAFKKGDLSVEIDHQIKPFSVFWKMVLGSMYVSITRFRIVSMAFLYLLNLFLILLIYSIYYRGTDLGTSFKYVSSILAAILIITFIIVNNQTMNTPFEQVIGYQAIRGNLLTRALTRIFKHKFFEKKYTFPGSNIYYDFITSTMNISNFPTVLEEIFRNNDMYDFKINTDEDGIDKYTVETLFKLIVKKNSVGHMCWMFFGSLVGTIISLKYLFAAGLLE